MQTPIEWPPSLWAAATPPGPALPALEGDATADVVVIGAGFTGLSTALHLARKGIDVTVVEAAEPGWGASGRNNGQVIPTLTRPEPEDIVRRHGAAGERLVALVRDCAQILFDTVHEEAIEAEAEQTGWVQPVHSPGRMKIAERRVRQWEKVGAPVALKSPEEIRAITGSDAWFGGWENRSGGHVNPLALARGLAAAVLRHGGRIFARTPVESFERGGAWWHASTPRGSVKARALVLATNAYTGEFSQRLAPEIAREVVPLHSWQLATTPLSDNVRKSIIPGRQAVSDTHRELYFARYDARNRLVTGGAILLPLAKRARIQPYIAARLERLFPQIGPVKFDYVWNGYVGITRDFFPRMHRLGPDGYAWAGCNGRAVGLSVALGRELAKAVTGTASNQLAFPLTDPAPLPLHGLARRLAPGMLLPYRYLDAREI
ncbi:MAG: FAD-binding oxidoreductase [Hyphomicrobiaceae bacterium]|nr:FAD-binding oxidoreductase [Hyphomicrobiaceae bacterium]